MEKGSARQQLAGRRALVTGATQGIGREICLALAAEGAAVWAAARRPDQLRELEILAGPRLSPLVVDLLCEGNLREAVASLLSDDPSLDLIVNCAGQYHRGTTEESAVSYLDEQYTLTVRAPYLLAQLLLPCLRRQPSDIVFLNSTVQPGRELGPYAAGQFAQRAIADSLRAELNEADIRVLSIFPGRTATPRQRRVFAAEQRADAYQPELLLQPEDIAMILIDILRLPRRAEVTEIWLRPAIASY
jgi:NAD(P)-dependent dehydrogenase (short-subunit alcohol dehydrogenase family)